MLSDVLKSEKAVRVSIEIIRVFNRLYGMVLEYRNIIDRLERLEKRQDMESRKVWKAIKMLQEKLFK